MTVNEYDRLKKKNCTKKENWRIDNNKIYKNFISWVIFFSLNCTGKFDVFKVQKIFSVARNTEEQQRREEKPEDTLPSKSLKVNKSSLLFFSLSFF